MERVCICCPIGCRLTIEEVSGEIVVSGNTCPRGREYGKSEFVLPKRVLTTTIQGETEAYSVKTKEAIPKKLLPEAMHEIKKIAAKNYELGDEVIPDLLGTGVSVIVTGKLKK